MPSPAHTNSSTPRLANLSNPTHRDHDAITHSIPSRSTAIPGCALPTQRLAPPPLPATDRSFRAESSQREIPLRSPHLGTYCHPDRRTGAVCQFVAEGSWLDPQVLSPNQSSSPPLSFRPSFTHHTPAPPIPCTIYRITTYSPNLALRCYHLPNRSAQHGILHCPGGLV
jgi:hypothetical protein